MRSSTIFTALLRTLPGHALLFASALLLVACDMASTTPRPSGGLPPPVTSTTTVTDAGASVTPVPTIEAGSATPVAAGQQSTAFPVESGDWADANGGPANTRARASAITSETVSALDVAWSLSIPGRGPYGAAAGAPVVAGGVVFLQDLASNVLAADLQTGEVIWRYTIEIPLAGPNGPVVADGRVFASTGSSGFVALDAATGDLLWSRRLEKDGFQPVVADDVVLVGTGNLAHVAGNSGFIHALDAATGEPVWSFQVVEDGFWGDALLNSGGGVWYPPAIDAERGLAYFGTGNAGPYPGTRAFPNGTSRPGDNLYTSSIVALDLETGRLAWHYQARPHGLFDHDFQSSPLLATVDGVDGTPRAVAIGSGKLGYVIAVDVETQEVAWSTAVGIHQNDGLLTVPSGVLVEVYPGIFGGVETPMAASGDRLFVPVVNLATRHSATGHGALDGSSALLNASDHTRFSEGSGELVALDAHTGDVVWVTALEGMPFGGATVVGDLVFTATYDGIITAYRTADGVEVWRMDAGGPINAWPAVQDDTILWPIGLGPSPRLIALRLSEASTAE